VRDLEAEIVYLNSVADATSVRSADFAEARNVSATLRSLPPMPHAPPAAVQSEANKPATMSSVQDSADSKR
jgi:hypothetical protein